MKKKVKILSRIDWKNFSTLEDCSCDSNNQYKYEFNQELIDSIIYGIYFNTTNSPYLKLCTSFCISEDIDSYIINYNPTKNNPIIRLHYSKETGDIQKAETIISETQEILIISNYTTIEQNTVTNEQIQKPSNSGDI